LDQAVEAFTVVLIIANGIFSFKGFRDKIFFQRRVFHVEPIIVGREYSRLVTSGFLHVGVAHWAFNMFALYSFSQGVGAVFGILRFVLIFFGSLIAGNLFSLFIHRKNPDYRACGASGAVSGVIFSSIIMFPGGSIYFLFFPMAIPSWIFGIGFIIVSIYGIRSRLGNIGHEAHLGGAIAGVLLSIAMRPALAADRPILAAAILVPFAVYLYLLIRMPEKIGRIR
jgi:membrane associated rhomboid family serine protease